MKLWTLILILILIYYLDCQRRKVDNNKKGKVNGLKGKVSNIKGKGSGHKGNGSSHKGKKSQKGNSRKGKGKKHKGNGRRHKGKGKRATGKFQKGKGKNQEGKGYRQIISAATAKNEESKVCEPKSVITTRDILENTCIKINCPPAGCLHIVSILFACSMSAGFSDEQRLLVQQQCSGKQICIIKATNEFFGTSLQCEGGKPARAWIKMRYSLNTIKLIFIKNSDVMEEVILSLKPTTALRVNQKKVHL